MHTVTSIRKRAPFVRSEWPAAERLHILHPRHSGSEPMIPKITAGFTLIELMVTVAVAAILLAVAAPSFTSFLASWRLTSTANELIAAVHYARSEAIGLNRNVDFCRASSGTATVCSGGANARWEHWIIHTGAVARRSSPGDIASIRVTSNFANDRLTFQPNGLPTVNAARTMTVCTTTSVTENRRIVTVGPGNRVSVERTTGTCP